MQSFADLGVQRTIVRALERRGITSPFPVQRLVLGDVIDGRDVLVKAPTGSGKTLAFGIPMVQRTAAAAATPAALVLAPTRELACQIAGSWTRSPRPARCGCAPSTAGSASRPRRGERPAAHILVATPGRLQDLLDRRLSRWPRSACSCSTRPTACSTWASARVDRIVRALPRDARRCSSRRRSTDRRGVAGALHRQTPWFTTTRPRRPAPPRASITASSPWRPRRGCRRCSRSSPASGISRSCSSARSAEPTASRSGSNATRGQCARDPWRQVPDASASSRSSASSPGASTPSSPPTSPLAASTWTGSPT